MCICETCLCRLLCVLPASFLAVILYLAEQSSFHLSVSVSDYCHHTRGPSGVLPDTSRFPNLFCTKFSTECERKLPRVTEKYSGNSKLVEWRGRDLVLQFRDVGLAERVWQVGEALLPIFTNVNYRFWCLPILGAAKSVP